MTPEHLQEQLEVARKRGDLDSQTESLRQLLSLAQQSGNGVAEVEFLRQLSNVYQKKGQLQKAHSYRVTAAQLAEQLGPACPLEH